MVDGRTATYFMVGVFSPKEIKNQERVLTSNTPTRPKMNHVLAEGEALKDKLAQQKAKEKTSKEAKNDDHKTKDDHATITENAGDDEIEILPDGSLKLYAYWCARAWCPELASYILDWPKEEKPEIKNLKVEDE